MKLYTLQTDKFSKIVIRYLKESNIDFEEIDIEKDKEAKEHLKELCRSRNLKKPVVPILEYNGQFIIGASNIILKAKEIYSPENLLKKVEEKETEQPEITEDHIKNIKKNIEDEGFEEIEKSFEKEMESEEIEIEGIEELDLEEVNWCMRLIEANNKLIKNKDWLEKGEEMLRKFRKEKCRIEKAIQENVVEEIE